MTPLPSHSSSLRALNLFMATLALCLGLCSTASSWAAVPLLQEPFPFEIELDNDKLKSLLKEGLKTQRSESPEFALFKVKERAARFDREIFKKLLKSQAYFKPKIETRFDDKKIIYKIKPGTQFKVEVLRYDLPEGFEDLKKLKLPIREGDPMVASKVLEAQTLLKEHIQQNHCLYEIKLSYDARINPKLGKAFLTFRLENSPQVNFGPPQLTGLRSIDASYLLGFFEFKEGECFKRKNIELTRLNLLQTNLIALVDTAIAQPQDGKVVVSVDVTERKHRTVKFGLGYESNEGLRLISGWQHRNTYSRGQELDIEAQLGEFQQIVATSFKVPHFKKRGQTLLLNSTVLNEQRESYESKFTEVGAGLSRSLRQFWSGNLGLNLEYSLVSEAEVIVDENNTTNPTGEFIQSKDRSENYLLLSMPVGLDYNRTDTFLNPRHGWTLSLKTRPFVDIQNTNTLFTKTTLSGSVYLSANEWFWRPTLAIRAATGTLSGIVLDEVPAHHRYYSGGGGSVRGYAYQKVGDLKAVDDDKVTVSGGLSFSELSVETRFMLNDSWGFVLFYDGGYAYSNKRERSFGQDFLWGAGVGLRYFTSFAPIRFDVATPLDKRCISGTELVDCSAEGAGSFDDNVQIYISIGQAF